MEQFLSLLREYKYVVLFPLCVVEGPIIAVLAGFLCATGVMDLRIAFPVIVAGDITGDSAVYLLGRWSKHGPGRVGRWLGIRPQRIERIMKVFVSHPIRTVALSKIMLGIGVAGIYLAGNSRIAYSRFIGICLLTSILQFILYIGIGYLSGGAFQQINHYLNVFSATTIAVSVAFILFFVIRSIRKKI